VTHCSVRELQAGETHLACSALAELRPHAGSADDIIRRIDERQRPEGFRLAGAFVSGTRDALAVAGFRVAHNLAWGRFLYVDDLVTLPDARSTGLGRALMEWLVAEARSQRCDALHLDSGTQRHRAHRFYLREGMHISSFHFAMEL